jgi:hypothetical protein
MTEIVEPKPEFHELPEEPVLAPLHDPDPANSIGFRRKSYRTGRNTSSEDR